jgi:hypothetical protein
MVSFEDEGKVQPAGTQYLGLIDSLIDLFKDRSASDVEVVFIQYKLVNGEKVVEDGQHVVEIRPIGIRAIVPEVREELRKQYDSAPLVSLMVLWMRRNVGKEGKMGVLAFHPVAPGERARQEHEYKPWESKAISWYLQRRCPDDPKKS